MVFLIGALLPLIDLWRWWSFHSHDKKGYYGERADWSAAYGGAIDFSCYVFRDRNRNGVLDLGDEPMASVAVEMTAPDGKRTVERSNLSGFVNFSMSASKRGVVIRRPGAYVFRVIVPPGWVVTSGNASQSTRFVARPGAPADIVAANPAGPVGLAPELFIAGRIVARGADGALTPASRAALSVVDPSGARSVATIGEGAAFRIPAAPGLWTLNVEGNGAGRRVERRVMVRDAPVHVGSIILGDPGGGVATEAPRARVKVDFESVTGTSVAKIPSGFAGLGWNYLNAIEVVFAGSAGYINTLTSGHYVGYSSSGHPVTLSRPGGFDFIGAYFGAALPDAEGETLRIEAFRAGAVVAGDEFKLSDLGPVWFDAGYRNVDRVVFTTLHYWQFATDDMEFGIPSVSLPASR